MKKIFTTISLVFVLISVNFAQSYKIDVVGEENEEVWTSSTDAMLYVLKQKPNAKAYVIIYRGKDKPLGYPIRLKERLRNHFLKYGLPIERFEILTGGEVENEKTEIWIVPAGSEPPLNKSVDEKIEVNRSLQFDSFTYPNQLWDGLGCCSIGGYKEQEKTASLNKFSKLLKENQTLSAYLIFYGQYCKECWTGKILLDSKKTIDNILSKEKNYLSKTHKIDFSRIKTVNGGYREWQAIELWLVPNGEKPPKPTPKTFPRKRKN